ncbi:MAG: response regulator [Nitrospirota bacterium]
MGKKILVADSDSVVQQVATYFLKLEGFDVETVGDGVSAMEAIEKIMPDVILLSPGLPGINGIEVSQLVREKSQYNNIPILFLAESEEPLLNNIPDFSDKYGVVRKPIDPTKLVSTVTEYMEKGVKVSKETGESLKSIEELLGWEITDKKEGNFHAAAEYKEEVIKGKSFDVSDVFSGIIEETKKETAAAGSEEVLTIERESEIISQKLEKDESHPSPIPSPLRGEEKACPDRSLRSEGETSEYVEKDLRNRITDEMIENMVRKIATDIVEKVARELVPDITEREIIKEIERLKGTE